MAANRMREKDILLHQLSCEGLFHFFSLLKNDQLVSLFWGVLT